MYNWRAGAVDAFQKAQIILDAAKVSAASGGKEELKQGSAVGECEGLSVPKHDAHQIEHFGADAVPLPEAALWELCGAMRKITAKAAAGLLTPGNIRFQWNGKEEMNNLPKLNQRYLKISMPGNN